MAGYKPGSMCLRGHDDGTGHSLRRKNGSCVACGNMLTARWKKENPERARENNRLSASRPAPKQKEVARAKLYRAEHREACRARTARWDVANPKRRKQTRDAWRKKNQARCTAQVRRYQATKLGATPAWADDFFMEEIYDLAQRRTKITGLKWHVDHIVPLQHPLVCGLHVEYNLQVITAVDNLRKGNSFTV